MRTLWSCCYFEKQKGVVEGMVSVKSNCYCWGSQPQNYIIIIFVGGGCVCVRFGKQFLFLKNAILSRHNQFYFKTIQPCSQR